MPLIKLKVTCCGAVLFILTENRKMSECWTWLRKDSTKVMFNKKLGKQSLRVHVRQYSLVCTLYMLVTSGFCVSSFRSGALVFLPDSSWHQHLQTDLYLCSATVLPQWVPNPENLLVMLFLPAQTHYFKTCDNMAGDRASYHAQSQSVTIGSVCVEHHACVWTCVGSWRTTTCSNS